MARIALHLKPPECMPDQPAPETDDFDRVFTETLKGTLSPESPITLRELLLREPPLDINEALFQTVSILAREKGQTPLEYLEDRRKEGLETDDLVEYIRKRTEGGDNLIA